MFQSRSARTYSDTRVLTGAYEIAWPLHGAYRRGTSRSYGSCIHRRTAACQLSGLPCDIRPQGASLTPARWLCRPEFAVSLAPAVPGRCASPDGTCQRQNIIDIVFKITGHEHKTYKAGH
jgi:hypothetical protein